MGNLLAINYIEFCYFEEIKDIGCYMLKENIIDFLKTGELTNFPFDTPLTTVLSMLGETKWIGPIGRKDKRIAVAKYGQIEFYFDHEPIQKLYGVQVTYTQMGEKGRMKVDYQGFEKVMSYTETKEVLCKREVDFEEKENEVDISKIIKTEGNVVFYFDDEDVLQKFGRFVQ